MKNQKKCDKMPDRREPVSQSLRVLLKKAGISQAELARRLDLHVNTVCKWHGDPPGYAVAYLELLIKTHQLCREITEIMTKVR